jgi:quinol monooxygenase YgiN
MNELQCVATLKIHDGKLDEFRRLAPKCPELVRTKDSGTLQYESYFNSDNTECLVFERYRNSQALLDHHKNLGDTMAAILQTCSGSGEICGTPSPELIEPLKDSPVQVYKPSQCEVAKETVDGLSRLLQARSKLVESPFHRETSRRSGA